MLQRRKRVIRADTGDVRFSEPLYTVHEMAYYLRRPLGTVEHWVHGRGTVGSLVTLLPSDRRRHAEVPFIGLAEALVVNFLRRRGISMPKIRRALDELAKEMSLDYALASRRLNTDGVEVFFRYAQAADDAEVGHLAEVIQQQYVLDGILDKGMTIVSFSDDGWAGRLVLPFGTRELIEVDPKRAFGKPLFINGGAPLMSVLERLRARESIQSVARDFDVPIEDIQDVILAFIPEPTRAAS
jgi:uncharacterized protein (DUF433 family)